MIRSISTVYVAAFRLVILSTLLAGCGGGSSGGNATEPPGTGYRYQPPAALADGWPVVHAAERGMEPVDLEAMVTAVDAGEYPHVDAIAVARGGDLVFERVFRTSLDAEDRRVGNDDLAMHAQFSASKSLTALLVGLAIEDGIFAGVDEPYLGYFDYVSYANPDPRKAEITLGNVLAMQLGLAWNEWDPPYTSPENQLIRFYADEVDFSKALLDLPMAADPGTRFAYNTIATVSLGQAIENRAPLALIDYGASRLMAPLEIEAVEFLETPTGLPNVGGGFYFRTRDMAKFAQLLLDGGRWKDQQVIGEAWVNEVLLPRTLVEWPNPEDWDWQLQAYGYQWWLGYYEYGEQVFETWVAWGFGGQWVIAVPALELAIAVNSSGYDGSDAALNEGHALVRRFLIGPLVDG